jgi:serine/threonine-protein kinase
VALKFVKLGEEVALKEGRSLDVLRAVRHPNIVATFGAWEVHGYLIIAMTLATGTLLDRCKEAQRDGHPGIPVRELLDYLEEAAKGLDYLNNPLHSVTRRDGSHAEGVAVCHGDVKPHNLLLIGNGVQVADFGLAQILDASIASGTQAFTPAYAAPEFFDSRTTPQSDQYSLAVTYCHLRGGKLPFQGSFAHIMAGHLRNPPDLSMVPENERAVLARALAKDPSQRWKTCGEFVRELRSGCVRNFDSPPPPQPPWYMLAMCLLALVGVVAGLLIPTLLPSRRAVWALMTLFLFVAAGLVVLVVSLRGKPR